MLQKRSDLRRLHKGEDAEFYLKKGFRVVAVEAMPELAQSATERHGAPAKLR
jgi:hypothetical protein